MKNFVPETTGYEYFKKQNDWVLKKKLFNVNNRSLCHFKGLILLNILVLQLPMSNKLFKVAEHSFRAVSGVV